MAEKKDKKPEVEPVEAVEPEKKPEPVKESKPERSGYTPNNCNF